MNKIKLGTFELDYELFTNAEPGCSVQFGMNYTLRERNNSSLCQLIFPTCPVPVGNNVRNQWNIDNHANGNSAEDLVFHNAENGCLVDTPKEIIDNDYGVVRTKFAVYIVDVKKSIVYDSGVSFGYCINTKDKEPKTEFLGFNKSTLTNEQKDIIKGKCPHIKFS